jgi:hypothetical protein
MGTIEQVETSIIDGTATDVIVYVTVDLDLDLE